MWHNVLNFTAEKMSNIIFFWQKQNDIHSFKSIEYIRYNNIINIVKYVKDETANILTTSKLIAYHDKMPTNNMIKSKSPEYPCFWICNVDVQIIDWICNWLTEVDLSVGTNEHRNKTRNQITPHKTTNNTTSHLDDEITKKEKITYVKITYLIERKGKRMQMGDSRSKNDLKSPLLDEWKGKKT